MLHQQPKVVAKQQGCNYVQLHTNTYTQTSCCYGKSHTDTHTHMQTLHFTSIRRRGSLSDRIAYMIYEQTSIHAKGSKDSQWGCWTPGGHRRAPCEV
jgi:hypothetical protein